MGREVDIADVRRRIEEFGPRATLITVTDAGLPHTSSVLVDASGGRLQVWIGPRTGANLRRHPGVTLLWFPIDGGSYQLIVDGRVGRVGAHDAVRPGLSEVTIQVTSGILHRLAGLTEAGPSCVALGAP